MAAFLDRLAKEILSQTGGQLDQYCVVLPNRRAGLFLKRYMAGYIEKPVWLPSIYSIEDFILYLSGYQLIDQVELIIDLYQVHAEVEGKDVQSFDVFLNWGKDLIRDFNEVDQYLADPHGLFTYLSEAKALSVWNLNHEPLTPFQQQYLKFYRSLYTYYDRLTQRLIAKGRVYQGLAYRKLAESIGEVAEGVPWKKVFFGGFNALTTAEYKIIEHLFSHNLAVIYWDADTYYMDDEKQEAGRFLRTYKDKSVFGPFHWVERFFETAAKEIQVIGIPKNAGQAKVMGNILENIVDGKEQPESTALVLIDENMLLPVLNSLPAHLQHFNITMGYPLKYTPVYDLIESVFALHENAVRFAGLSGGSSWKLYHKDVTRLLNHPYILGLAQSPDKVRNILEGFRKKGIVFHLPEQLFQTLKADDESFAEKVTVLFNRWENGISDALDSFLRILEALRDSLMPVRTIEGQIEMEYLYHMSRLIVRLRTVLEPNPVTMEIRSLRKMMAQLAGLATIPFYGEPLRGLQIMGMLETRNLDFKNVIMLSANEDLLPAGKHGHSFIPLDIRLAFDLPVYRDHDAVFAYHFYRLLQRAEKIFLLYNTEPTELGGGEQSRFITQIQHELPVFNPLIRIRASLASLPAVATSRDNRIIIEKDEHVRKRLVELAETGLSPSLLNAYRSCRLRFYFQHVAEIPERKELAETIDAKTMGTVIHDVMKELYEPYLNARITTHSIEQMVKNVESLVLAKFQKHYPHGDVHFGKNLLIVNIAQVLIRNYLNAERHFIRSCEESGHFMTINLLESPLHTFLDVTFRGEPLQVKIKGTPDRIDKVGPHHRIIDYKTGSVRSSDLSLRSWDQLMDDPQAGKSFQVLTYGWLYHLQYPSDSALIEPGIISFRTPSQGLMMVHLPDKASLDHRAMDQIREMVQLILDELFDTDKPFTQTEDVRNCEYCSFRGICFR